MFNKIAYTIRRGYAGGQEESLNNIAFTVQGFSFTNNGNRRESGEAGVKADT